jgi:glutaredoxin
MDVLNILRENPNKTTIFISKTCPFCAQALNALSNADIPHEIVEVNSKIRESLKELTNQTSVPSTWFGEQFLGGCNDGPEAWMGLIKLIKNGQLTKDGFTKPQSGAVDAKEVIANSDNITSAGATKRMIIGAVIYGIGLGIFWYMSVKGVEEPWKYGAGTAMPFITGAVVGIQGPTKT